MPLTPLDIHNKEFSRRLRGYDVDEVNEFLDQVIKDYEMLLKENKELGGQLAGFQERINHFQNVEETLSRTLVVAQETADELRAGAKKEAQLIVKESEKNADRIINEALIKARNVSIDIEEMRKKATIYRTRFRSLIQAQLELLDNEVWDSFESLDAALPSHATEHV